VSFDAVVSFLRSEGAGAVRHYAGRTLLDHLVQTAAIVRRWGQPEWLEGAALLHSVYGTDVYRERLLALSRRGEVASLAGERAERLAYMFSTTPRGPLLAGTYRWMPAGDATRDELDCLVLLHMANLAEQARGRPWLVKLREMAELLVDSEVVRLPVFLVALEGLSDEDEALALRAYGSGRYGLAAAVCPVVGEPCVFEAYACWRSGDGTAARAWAQTARRRLLELGVGWDKRLSFEEWLELAGALEQGVSADEDLGDPRALYEAVAGGQLARRFGTAGGRARFDRYIESLGPDPALGRIYPDLPSRPFWEASELPLARYLELHFAAVREELLALDPSRFHRESEPIRRAGDWDVAFFYERGRRHDEVCDACPVTTRGIDAYGAIRTMAGLIYASRMRAGTHIHAHRGPTNLRLRCHLGISVPDGDCAIRVGEETRRWREGRCLVFDDHFEHEAWNRTGEDRLVLIVDLWHPALSPEEVRLLEGLHAYTHAHARRLSRYWSANAAAASRVG
jgi:aspartate beta-hydroxylase